MNEDGSLGIPHGASQEEETPIAEPNFSSNQEDTGISSTGASAVDDTAISHDSPIEAPIDAGSGEEPVDIFASPEEKAAEAESASMPGEAPTAITSGSSNSHSITNNPFHNRNRFQANTNTTNSNIPQFFSDSMVTSTPISQPRQSKKGLIIGIVVGAIALGIILLLVVLIIGKNNTKDSSGNVVNTSSKEDFYKYANLLLYDKDSTAKLEGDYNANENYSYRTKLSNMDIYDSSFVDNIWNQYNTFYEKFNKSNEKLSNGKAYNYIKNYKNLLDFVKKHPSNEDYTKDAIMTLYLQQGSEAASAEVDDILGKFNSEKNDYEKDFHDIKEAELMGMVKLLDQAKKKGCINGENITPGCIEKNSFLNEEKQDLKQIVLDGSSDSSSFITARYDELGYDCWEIADALENVKGEE